MLRFVTLVSLALATTAHAQTHPFQLVGFTTNTVVGDAGVLQMSRECWLEFGDGARMCTSVEVMETTALPGQSGSPPGWVRPVYAPHRGTGYLDASGYKAGLTVTCEGWATLVGSGMAVSPTGAFSARACNALTPVACCAPTPIPEPKN